jgi:hypothetical protein
MRVVGLIHRCCQLALSAFRQETEALLGCQLGLRIRNGRYLLRPGVQRNEEIQLVAFVGQGEPTETQVGVAYLRRVVTDLWLEGHADV